MFALQFDKAQIPYWADKYDYKSDEEIDSIASENKARGFLKREELIALCQWKTERSKSRVAKNTDRLVEEATRIALSARSEQLRIFPLLALEGVGWPTASVILHFWHSDPYPVLDFRALWSLGVEKPAAYRFDFWWEYTLFCRKLAQECGVSMRTLDRALWKFSDKNQGKATIDRQ